MCILTLIFVIYVHLLAVVAISFFVCKFSCSKFIAYSVAHWQTFLCVQNHGFFANCFGYVPMFLANFPVLNLSLTVLCMYWQTFFMCAEFWFFANCFGYVPMFLANFPVLNLFLTMYWQKQVFYLKVKHFKWFLKTLFWPSFPVLKCLDTPAMGSTVSEQAGPETLIYG